MVAIDKIFIIGIILFSIAAILHMFGMYVLTKVKTNALCSPTQKIYLRVLCLIEALMSMTAVTRRIFLIVDEEEFRQLQFWDIGFLNTLYISTMILLTLDRFLNVYSTSSVTLSLDQ